MSAACAARPGDDPEDLKLAKLIQMGFAAIGALHKASGDAGVAVTQLLAQDEHQLCSLQNVQEAILCSNFITRELDTCELGLFFGHIFAPKRS